MIYIFEKLEDAEAVTEEKHIWVDGDIIRVYTGDDFIKESDIIKVENWQLRLAFNHLQLRDSVEAAITASGDSNLKDLWEYFPTYESNHPLVLQVASAIGKTEEELKQIFKYASGLLPL